MPNPGAFRGSRKEFLLGEKEAYKLGVDGNYVSEALAIIYRRYFKRYPIDLLHNTEPSAEHLAAVDDNAPDPEIQEPDIFALPRDEYERAMEKVKQRKKNLEFRQSQIKRWMAYQYMKDHHIDPKETGAHNPYRVLLCKLTGRGVERPRRKTPVNVWRKKKREVIELEVKRRHRSVGKEQLANLHSEIAREMFAKLDMETRHEWEVLAGEEHQLALDQWSSDMESPPSSDPVDRQCAIQGLVSFVQPILDMICDATGWKSTLIVGGPEPAQDGQLNVVSIHSGTTSGDVKMTFGYAERANIKKYLIPMFGSFLQKCYSPAECRSRALPSHEGHLQVSQLDIENANITIHSITRKIHDDNKATRANGSNTVSPPLPLYSTPASTDQPPQASPPMGMSPETSNQPTPPSIPSRTSNPAVLFLPPANPTANPASNRQSQGHTSERSATPYQSGSVDDLDSVLDAETDTLSRVTAPPEDEIGMTMSRSVSPVSAPRHSPCPSPPASRCPSPPASRCPSPPASHCPSPPALRCPSPSGIAAPSPSQSNNSSPPIEGPGDTGLLPNGAVSIVEAVALGSDENEVQPHIPAGKGGADPGPEACSASENGPSTRRSTRAVKKTAKLMLMEEKGAVRGGKKRKAEVLGDGNSTVNQAPATKRGRKN